jgi:hypothetical protein
MSEKLSPNEILNSTESNVREIISEILNIEKEYQHLKNLTKVKTKEKEIGDRVKKLIENRTSI